MHPFGAGHFYNICCFRWCVQLTFHCSRLLGLQFFKKHRACVNVSFLSLSEQSRWDVGSLEAAGRMFLVVRGLQTLNNAFEGSSVDARGNEVGDGGYWGRVGGKHVQAELNQSTSPRHDAMWRM